ncbi:MAG: signal peptide peptidase SppA [Cellvibrionaceae bacterium]
MGFFKRKSNIDPNSEHRDWEVVSSIAQTALDEQRKARRWGIFFKVLTFVYITFVLVSVFMQNRGAADKFNFSEPHTGVVYVEGVIAEGEDASANNIVAGLRRAFESEGAMAVMLIINSPGGSPVQAGYVYDEVKRLRVLHPDKKVYAVIKDLGASGGYYIAAAADEIYADKASLVGSIGVTASGFGFEGLMEKVGVERRNFTSGEHKSFLDPFGPLKEDEKQFWESVLQNTHEQFIRVVKEGRGDRLSDNEDLFSGLVWNGEQAIELGLIDGLGSPGSVARDIIGQDQFKNYTPQLSPLEEFTRRFGTAVGLGVGKALGVSSDSPVQLR